MNFKIQSENLYCVKDSDSLIRKNPDGTDKLSVDGKTPIWRINVLMSEKGQKSTPLAINIPSMTDPLKGVMQYERLVLTGLELNVYTIDGRTINSLSAQSVKKG